MQRPLDREGVATMLWQQADNLDITDIQASASPYSFFVTRQGKQQYVLILVRSSEFWTKRVHLSPVRPSLLIVWNHDSCLPVDVISLKTGVLSPAYSNQSIQKRSRCTSNILLGMLMCGMQSAYDMLEQLPESSKFRYLARVKALTKRPRGRPLKV
jgi:hypothetical protein